jgi:hypothetical protein
MWKRVAIVVLSSWVLFSGNAWPHSRANQLNNTIVGTGLLFFGVLSMRHEWARYLTLGFGIWLFVFTVAAGHISAVTYWNDAMIALAVFILSLLGGESPRRALRSY